MRKREGNGKGEGSEWRGSDGEEGRKRRERSSLQPEWVLRKLMSCVTSFHGEGNGEWVDLVQ